MEDSPLKLIRIEPKAARIYSEDEKREAVALYVIWGTQSKVAELTGIPQRTISDWIKSDWWAEYRAQLVRAAGDEAGASFRRILKKAAGEIEDRLVNGDVILDRKGREKRKPISAKDLTVIMAIATDKDRILRGEPTSISAKATDLKGKAAEFEAIAQGDKKTG